MPNPHRGEAELKADGKTYRVRFSINALVELEDHFSKSVNEVMEEMAGQNPRIKTLREVVRFALSENNPAPDAEMTGRIMSEAGSQAVNEALQKAIALAFPPTKGEAENPQKASPDGTGKAS